MKLKARFQRVQAFCRKLGLLRFVELADYYILLYRYRKANAEFVQKTPDFALPPPHLAYDAYSVVLWPDYKLTGEATAVFLRNIFFQYYDYCKAECLFEWGCGPGRVIRHIVHEFKDTKIYASDYNYESIAWCIKNIPGVFFFVNDLEAHLPLCSNSFDFVYAISVFTHLSEQNGLAWAQELLRVLKPGAIFITSLKGDSYLNRLLPSEKRAYFERGVVIRAGVQEGKKMFAAFHNPAFAPEGLLRGFEIVRHVPSGFPFVGQDLWIARKPR